MFANVSPFFPVNEGKAERRRLACNAKQAAKAPQPLEAGTAVGKVVESAAGAGAAAVDGGNDTAVQDCSDRGQTEQSIAAGADSGCTIVTAATPNKLFIDVGLKRPLHTLMQLLDRLLPPAADGHAAAPLPLLVVIKSSPLLAELKRDPLTLWRTLPRTEASENAPSSLPALLSHFWGGGSRLSAADMILYFPAYADLLSNIADTARLKGGGGGGGGSQHWHIGPIDAIFVRTNSCHLAGC